MVSGLKRMTVEEVRIRPRAEFDPRWLLSPRTLKAHGHVVKQRIIEAAFLNLVTANELHVALLGQTPVAAWIPFPGSHVAIDETPTAFPAEAGLQRLVERYPRNIGDEARTEATTLQRYPLGDFLGPDVVVWTDDPTAGVLGRDLERSDEAKEHLSGVVTAFRITGSTYSTRIAAVPLSTDARKGLEQEARDDPAGARKTMFSESSDDGEIQLTVDVPVTPDEYTNMRRRLAADDTVAVKSHWDSYEVDNATGKTTPMTGPVVEVERYPPLPSNAGFNLFGPMLKLVLHDARGALMFGDRAVNLEAPSIVSLSGIGVLHRPSSDQSVAVPMASSGHRADLQFSTVGTVTVNDETETSYLRRHRSGIESITLIATVGGVALALLQVLVGLVKSSPSAGSHSGIREKR
jgi:hypothetical protein